MSNAEDLKFLKIQTCVLKVNIHCEGCKKKVKKLLQRIDGVYTTVIEAEQGKVTVSGTADFATIITKLCKAGKHAELWAAKGNNKNSSSNPKSPLDFAQQKPHNSTDGKDQKLQQLQKQLVDMKLQHIKDGKSVKFSVPHHDLDVGSEFDDDFDDDDYFDESTDGSDDDIDDDDKIDGKAMSLPTKGLVTAKKGGGGEVHVKSKIVGGGTQEAKNGNNISTKNANSNNNKGAANGNGIGHEKGSGGGTISVGDSSVANGGHKNEMINHGMVGNPAGGASPGFYSGGAAAPTMAGSAANPYQLQQQQYLAEMMQQQRMMMNGYPVAYGYPMPYPNTYSSYFSDENTSSSCTIM